MTPEKGKRLRYSALLCAHGLRNLAYYRVGWSGKTALFSGEFMATMNGNFIDICTLEWCKLFGDKKAKHHWARIVDDPATYEPALLIELGMDSAQFADYIIEMREYRDKFVAHLDEEDTMWPPILDAAEASFAFHLTYLTGMAGGRAVLRELAFDPNDYYSHCYREAEAMYARLNGENNKPVAA